jgi:hypothetical protein
MHRAGIRTTPKTASEAEPTKKVTFQKKGSDSTSAKQKKDKVSRKPDKDQSKEAEEKEKEKENKENKKAEEEETKESKETKGEDETKEEAKAEEEAKEEAKEASSQGWETVGETEGTEGKTKPKPKPKPKANPKAKAKAKAPKSNLAPEPPVDSPPPADSTPPPDAAEEKTSKKRKREPGVAVQVPRTSHRTEAKRHASEKRYKRSGPSSSDSITFVSNNKIKTILNRWGITIVRHEVFPIIRTYLERFPKQVADIVDAMLEDGKRITVDSMMYAIDCIENRIYHRRFIAPGRDDLPISIQGKEYVPRRRKVSAKGKEAKSTEAKETKETEDTDMKHLSLVDDEKEPEAPASDSQPSVEEPLVDQPRSQKQMNGHNYRRSPSPDRPSKAATVVSDEPAVKPKSVPPPRQLPRLSKAKVIVRKTLAVQMEEPSQETDSQPSVADATSIEERFPPNQQEVMDAFD